MRRDKKEDCLQLRNDDERGRREEDEEQGGGMAVVMDRTPRENIVAGGQVGEAEWSRGKHSLSRGIVSLRLPR